MAKKIVVPGSQSDTNFRIDVTKVKRFSTYALRHNGFSTLRHNGFEMRQPNRTPPLKWVSRLIHEFNRFLGNVPVALNLGAKRCILTPETHWFHTRGAPYPGFPKGLYDVSCFKSSSCSFLFSASWCFLTSLCILIKSACSSAWRFCLLTSADLDS